MITSRRDGACGRRTVVRVSMAWVGFLTSACGGGGTAGPSPPAPPPSGPTVRTITVSPGDITLTEIGASTQLSASARDGSGQVVAGVTFTYRSTDPAVASVDGSGRVTARANGGAEVEVGASGVEARARVAVRASQAAWLQMGAGLINSCGLSTHGLAYCWGDNVHGQLANGETAQVVPTPVLAQGGILFFEALTVGGGHICGLASGGEAYCWGNTFFGEGGFGESTGVWTEVTPVSGGHAFARLSAGGSHTCGLTTAGAAYCWGVNDHGQLGDGTTSNRSTPSRVAGGHVFVEIDAASQGIDNHTCAVASDGRGFCWGVNANGELGDGTTTDRLEPVEVGGGLTFALISAGGWHTCGLTSSGAAYCWGLNGNGQLGDGTMQDRPQPVEVTGSHVFDLILAGDTFTCGRTTSGAAYCWGTNGSGQLGDGTTQGRAAPVAVSGGLNWRQLDVGKDHVCGVATTGTAYCWGSDGSRKLGGDAPGDRLEPHAILAPHAIP